MAVQLVQSQAQLPQQFAQVFRTSEILRLLLHEVRECGATHIIHQHAALIWSISKLMIGYNIF